MRHMPKIAVPALNITDGSLSSCSLPHYAHYSRRILRIASRLAGWGAGIIRHSTAPTPAAEEVLRYHPESGYASGLRETLTQSYQRLEHLSSLDGRTVGPTAGRRTRQFSQRQHAVRERTEAFKNRLDQMSQFIPFLSRELWQNIGEAGEFMGEAQGSCASIGLARPSLLRKKPCGVFPGQQAMQQAMHRWRNVAKWG